MRRLLSCAVFILSGCMPTNKIDHPNSGTEPEFISYVQQFEVDYGYSIGNFPIMLLNQDKNILGMCKVWSDGYRQIEIDPSYWNRNTTTNANRKALIYHELGHCILNRGHDPSFILSSFGRIAKSIMNPYLMYELSMPQLQTYYINELFSRQASIPLSATANGCIEHVN
jgi:hypothetical protein